MNIYKADEKPGDYLVGWGQVDVGENPLMKIMEEGFTYPFQAIMLNG